MRPRRARLAAALTLAFASSPAMPQAPPSTAQQSRVEAGPVSVPIEIREQFLGKSGEKTVVRFVMTAARSDFRIGPAGPPGAPRRASFVLIGEAKDASGKFIDTFRAPVDVDLSETEAARPVRVSFLAALPQGELTVQFRLEGAAGRTVATRAIFLTVPRMSSEFRAEEAGTDTAGLPSAAAVVLESENRPAVPKEVAAKGIVKIIAPRREVPVGLLRVEAEVAPPATRVEFWLDDKRLVVRNRPPYSVEIDLGKIPKKQTLKALAFDAQGNFLDADAWALNERDARLAVRILELPTTSGASVELKVAVQSIAGGEAKGLKLFLDADLVKEWAGPPYTVFLPAERLKRATLIRATAVDAEGKEFSDVKLLKGEKRFLSRVEVNLVELHISVYDGEGRFVKGLPKDSFTVFEDGVKQEISAFEFAEALPLSLGIVIDGSGSMKPSMPLVHEAAGGFVERLVREKDQGFVIEFRESPALLSPLTKKSEDLLSAIRETHADGATALYDAVILALYQFRAVPGRKAIVVLTDGADNHSWADYDTLRRYARTAGIPIYFIGMGIPFLELGIKPKMKELAGDAGAEAFFIGKGAELAEVYRKIETELRAQYFVTYLTNSKKGENEFRTVEVKLGDPKLRPKTIRGYFP
ncbi:MAG: VWA domain-containing protein [Thermoanaerobaculia bacterium]